MKSFIICLLILAVFFAPACKVRKHLIEKKDSISLNDLYTNISASSPGFKTIEIRFNVKYETPNQTLSLKGSLRIIKDSLIWATLSPGLGIEGARFLCTPDSLFILDRINKNLTRGSYSFFNAEHKIDVDFSSIQSILTNQFFIYPYDDERMEFTENYKVISDSINFQLYSKSGKGIENLLHIDKNSYRLIKYMINDIPNARNLTGNYQLNKLPEGILFPKTLTINSVAAGKFFNLKMEYTKVIIDSELNFPFTIPSNYKVIDK
jgi:hypothetical protein